MQGTVCFANQHLKLSTPGMWMWTQCNDKDNKSLARASIKRMTLKYKKLRKAAIKLAKRDSTLIFDVPTHGIE
jgi:hypothetical protein